MGIRREIAPPDGIAVLGVESLALSKRMRTPRVCETAGSPGGCEIVNTTLPMPRHRAFMTGGSVGPLLASLGTIRQDFSTHVETAR